MDVNLFHQLAMAELDPLYRFAYHLTKDALEAEDLVQETYLRAAKKCDDFKLSETGIRPWLFKILHNLVNSRFVKDKKDRRVLSDYRIQKDAPYDNGGEENYIKIEGVPATAWSHFNWDLIDERLKAAVLDLPLSTRAVFLLAAVERMKYGEIAEVTNTPIGTVMSRLSRARAKLAHGLIDVAADNNIRLDATASNFDNEQTDLKKWLDKNANAKETDRTA